MALTLTTTSGGLILTGSNNAYSGGTTVLGGNLQIGDGQHSRGSLPGNVVLSTTSTNFGGEIGTAVNLAGSLTFNTPAAMSVSVSGNISSSGSAPAE